MNMNWGECYYDHYTRFLDHLLDRKIFRQNNNLPSVQILSYDKVFKDCQVFCSLGLSHYSSDIGGVAEVCLPVDDGWKDVPYVLANALFFMVQNGMTMGWGLSISGIERISTQFANNFNKAAIYFTNVFGLPEEFSKVKCGDGTGKMYLAIFISEAEHRFFKQHGAEAFEELLDVKKVDPFSLQRSSCV